eukprot:CAMPEP_0194779180 /NCGR_PEP_ID=MMETSP0323_2-20130528/70330_1 /TAXON_ID=2866 ORGANISM="Crypthecodinium cohnii, Strain Seligo" /NCGR_SAMPLE_ID=MMETSP0323_2 /ASSEMBLY_ACC=CAM_ASM_000346 /LENGTH=73 /DNA_ID=CAMNT_0039716703 /DNA_START=29 /DNA_END=250 /DNA_ORIENTATION=-
MFSQERRDLGTPLKTSPMHRGITILFADVHVSTLLQQVLCRLELALQHSVHEGSLPSRTDLVDVLQMGFNGLW